MKFAAKIKAEPGWKVALAKADGGISFIEIELWGVVLTANGVNLVPLDHVREFDIREKKNFLMIIDPNVEYDFNGMKLLAETKAKELGLSRT